MVRTAALAVICLLTFTLPGRATTITSTFTTGLGGWTAIDTTGGTPSHIAAGGNPGGYLSNSASPLSVEPLRDALKPITSDIRTAFVYGSVAKGTDQATSDIDLMVVSDTLSYGDVFGALDKVSRALGRTVNPTVYSHTEFSKRMKTDKAFVTRVLEGPKVWVIGSGDDYVINA